MTARDRYSSPAAFRRALTDRLTDAAQRSRWTLQQLQRQVAYDRLLERLYLVDDGWIVKGATALLARDLGVRASLDVDLYRAVDQQVAEADARRAAGIDVGDWFRFEIGPQTTVGGDGVRLPVDALIGATTWTAFHVDLFGTTIRMTGQPEDVPPVARGIIPDVGQRGYRAYPLVDHIADKVAATYERHGAMMNPSTRYRDLVDLVTIVRGASVAAIAQMTALRSEFTRRGLVLPDSFDVPDRSLWERGYVAEARRSSLGTAQTLDEALAIVRPFLDPLIRGRATGVWDHAAQRWGKPRHRSRFIGVTEENRAARVDADAVAATPSGRSTLLAKCVANAVSRRPNMATVALRSAVSRVLPNLGCQQPQEQGATGPYW